jgi:hypothetical protein
MLLEVRSPNIFNYGRYATAVVVVVVVIPVEVFLMCIGGIDASTTNDVIPFVFIIYHGKLSSYHDIDAGAQSHNYQAVQYVV